jgi:RNA polymerase sigma-70 factor (ECF subfamily)
MTGDDFSEFYAAHHRRLVGQLFVFLGCQQDAEEVVQEAFSRALVRWERIAEYDAPDAWVRRVAFNLASSRRRRAVRAARALLGLQPAIVQPGPTEDSAYLLDALRALPARHRRVVVLHYVADLPIRDIAADLGVPEATVKTWLRRGRERLRHVMIGSAETPAPPGRTAHTRR